MTLQVERLVGHLFDGATDDALACEVAGWLEESARLRAFAAEHRDKIRKKLRGAVDAEARRDVRAEVLAARLLLADRRVDVAFEAYGAGKPGPDFTVSFRSRKAFNLEVTRLRRPPDAAFTGPLLAKLRQLPPGGPNALLVALAGGNAAALDAGAAARQLRERADAKEDAYFAGRGFGGGRGFYERFLRLSGVVAFCGDGEGEARAALWRNPSARHPLPDAAARACLACLRDG